MSYEQLHFAFGASIPFVVALFYWRRKFIFVAPLIMTVSGLIAFLPYYYGWSGAWTNIFFLYDLVHNSVGRGQFFGFVSTVAMFTVILGLQVYYLWGQRPAENKKIFSGRKRGGKHA